MTAIGVTGHRILADLDKVTRGVDEALDQIQRTFGRPPLTVISALAEGADRLVVHRALARPETRLVVPLPLPVAQYMLDFESIESRDELLGLLERADDVITLPAVASREAAYEGVGSYILDHADVLLAIWDGRPTEGQGGTASVVARARQRGLPIVRVHAGNRKPGTHEPTSLGAEQGMVTTE
jgi:hypothetical protein